MSNDTTTTVQIDRKAAQQIIRAEGRLDTLYSTYVDTYGVTLDTVAEHAAGIVAVKFPDVKPSSRADKDTAEYRAHVLRSKIRNGLNRALGKQPKEAEQSEKYATALALKDSSLEAVLAKVKAEWTAANTK